MPSTGLTLEAGGGESKMTHLHSLIFRHHFKSAPISDRFKTAIECRVERCSAMELYIDGADHSMGSVESRQRYHGGATGGTSVIE